MVTIKSDIPEKGDKWLKEVEKQVELAARRSMTRAALLGEKRVKGIMERESYDTGRMLRSVTSRIIKQGDLLRLEIGSNLDYAMIVEEGRKPGKWPNLDAITRWVGRKLRREGVGTKVNVTFDQLKALARTGGKKATKQQEAYRQHLAVIFLVGRKIATKGIKQKLIFWRIRDGLLSVFRKDLERELKAIR